MLYLSVKKTLTTHVLLSFLSSIDFLLSSSSQFLKKEGIIVGLSFKMNIDPIVRYLLVTALVCYLAYEAWEGVTKVKNDITG